MQLYYDYFISINNHRLMILLLLELKYLYNHIKQTKLMGKKLTKKDLDWPYYKLIDEIMIKQRLRRVEKSKLRGMKTKNEVVNEGIDTT